MNAKRSGDVGYLDAVVAYQINARKIATWSVIDAKVIERNRTQKYNQQIAFTHEIEEPIDGYASHGWPDARRDMTCGRGKDSLHFLYLGLGDARHESIVTRAPPKKQTKVSPPK